MRLYRSAGWAALLIACVCGSCLSSLFISEPLEVGKEAPAFSLPNLDGETVSLSDFRGQPILLNFWVTT